MRVLAASSEPGILTVVLMGLITVFVALICLIGIIRLMGLIMESISSRKAQNAPAAPAPAPKGPAPAAAAGGNQQALVAAIACAIAEDMGESVEHLRIHSIRRL